MKKKNKLVMDVEQVLLIPPFFLLSFGAFFNTVSVHLRLPKWIESNIYAG